VRRTPTLIVGGGPAGTAAAILLARGGQAPLLIERYNEPRDIVCGGFLGGDAIGMLARIGVDIRSLGAAPIHRARLVAGNQTAETSLPFAAAGLSRRTLDTTLLARAISQGARVERGTGASRIELDNRCVHLSDGSTIVADALFLATGKHDLRGGKRTVTSTDDPALGLRIRLDPSRHLARALEGAIELHLFAAGYAGLILQEDRGVNLCLSVAESRLRAAGGLPERLIADLAAEAPLLADRYGAALSAGHWSTVARLPYGWRAPDSGHGIFRIGDQAVVIASLAGDGIAIALDSACRTAKAYLSGGGDAATAFQPAFSRHARRPVLCASLLKQLGETPWIARPLIGLFRHAPSLLSRAAAMTRIVAA